MTDMCANLCGNTKPQAITGWLCSDCDNSLPVRCHCSRIMTVNERVIGMCAACEVAPGRTATMTPADCSQCENTPLVSPEERKRGACVNCITCASCDREVLETASEVDAGVCKRCANRLAMGERKARRFGSDSIERRKMHENFNPPSRLRLSDHTKADAGWHVQPRDTRTGRVYDVVDAQGTKQATCTRRPEAWAMLEEELED